MFMTENALVSPANDQSPASWWCLCTKPLTPPILTHYWSLLRVHCHSMLASVHNIKSTKNLGIGRTPLFLAMPGFSHILSGKPFPYLLKKFAAISGVERTKIETKLPESPKNPSRGRKIPWRKYRSQSQSKFLNPQLLQLLLLVTKNPDSDILKQKSVRGQYSTI